MRGGRHVDLIGDIQQRIAAGWPPRGRRVHQYWLRGILIEKRAKVVGLNVGERYSQRRATSRLARFVKMNETVTGGKPQLGILRGKSRHQSVPRKCRWEGVTHSPQRVPHCGGSLNAIPSLDFPPHRAPFGGCWSSAVRKFSGRTTTAVT